MKKALLTLMMCVAAHFANAQTVFFPETSIRIYLNVSIIPPVLTNPSHPKSPGEPPVVYLDAPTLYICSEHEGYTLTVKDSDETVVFSTYIPEGTYTAVLPSTLSDNYILQLSDDTYVYEGEIEL